MRLTLTLDNKQAEYLKKALDANLASLVLEEMMVKDALDNKENNKEQETNLQTYLVDVSCQRVVVAELLGTLKEADPEHRIITT